MTEKKFIGFDLGAESGRCVVASLFENRVILNEVHRFNTHNYTKDNQFHWDISAIFNEIIEGLSKAKKEFGNEFEGIGIDTWAVDYALIDEMGKIINDPFHYRDNRTDGIMEEAFSIISKSEIYNKTGIQFVQFNTIYQLLSEKKNKPNSLNIADKMLLIPDYINFLLTGKKKAEYTNASTTGLVEPLTRKWSWELIDTFGLPRKIFPELVGPGTVIGTILPLIAKKSGLSDRIPVIASTSHDTASAVVSVPTTEKNSVFLSSGTWSLMGIELDRPILSSQAMGYNFTNEGGYENTVRFLKNIIGLWPVQECKRYWQEKSNDYSYQELTSMANDFGFANAWVDLNDPRFLKAGEMPEKIIAYLKETGQHINPGIGFIIRVILESLAFSYRNTLNEIELTTGEKIKRLHAVGGGIQNELLTQLTADAIGRVVIAGPIEGTIIGNIGVQAITARVVENLHDWRMMVSNSFNLKKYEPQSSHYFNENEEKYNNILRKFREYAKPY